MKRLGFGIIGLGMIAGFHAKAIAQMDDAWLVSGFDTVSGKAEAFAKANNCRAYNDIDKFLQDPDLDVVTIATPSGLHLGGALAAAKAKKHVIVEKPLEITKERCRQIIDECRRNNVKLEGIFPSRCHDAPLLVKKAVDEGRFGKIVMADAEIKWFRTQEYYDSGAWRGTWRFDGGGALMNQGIHAIDLLQWFMGPVQSVTAYAGTLAHQRIEVEDTAVVMLKFGSGALGCIEATTCAYPGALKRIEILGTKGSAILEEETIVKWTFAEERPEDEEIRRRFQDSTKTGGGAGDPKAIGFHGHKRLFEDMVRAINNDGEPFITGEEAEKAVEIIEASYISSRENREVKLPL